MAQSKKHLKYRATKAGSPVLAKPTAPAQSSPTKSKPQSAGIKVAKVQTEFTRLSSDQRIIIRSELKYIMAVAIGILSVYAVIWAGFHYAGWSEAVLRYIPHGQ